MTHYPHFAFPNLFLLNGYREVETHRGLEVEYEQEDGLEQCIRCLLVHKPERLRGWDLRFLRRGLVLSQAELGAQIDRDAQTVARWEKSNEPIPSFVDLAIRVRFAARFEPRMPIQELLSYVDGKASKLPASIYLRLTNQGWQYEHEPKVKFALSHASGEARAQIGPNAGIIYRLPDSFARVASGSAVIEPSEWDKIFALEAKLPEGAKVLREGQLLIVESKLPKSVADSIAIEPSQPKTQKLKVEIKGSAHEYASATIH